MNPEIGSKGTKRWFNLEGQLDRLDGPAVEWADGYKAWYKDDLLHRLDGPAVEYADGTNIWYKDGLRHRLDGPAYERASGHREWWVNGKQTTEDKLESAVKLYYCWLVLES